MSSFFFAPILNTLKQKGEGIQVKTEHKTVTGGSTIIKDIGIGIGVGIIISATLLLALTSLVLNGKINSDTSHKFVFGIRTAGAFAAAFVTTALFKKKHLQMIALTASVYLLILLAGGIVIYDGSFVGFGSGVLSMAIGSSIVYAIRMVPTEKRQHRHNRVR